MVIRIRIPALSSMLLANLVFVLGLLGIAVSVGALAGPWWGVLGGSILAAGVGYLSMVSAARAEPAAAAAVDEGQAPEQLHAVEEPAAA
ncbi:hypothetical protein [Amycolatopsis sp. cmx-4-68]|uniref:hypothetical protein n=1 Tax=Amycolatopsis sp. cmx-4-68 TaxID=2790938 RepID=UPI00397C9C8C